MTIGNVGFGSSQNVGSLELSNNLIRFVQYNANEKEKYLKPLDSEKTRYLLEYTNRSVGSFAFVAHILLVKENERKVIENVFLTDEDDCRKIQRFLDSLNSLCIEEIERKKQEFNLRIQTRISNLGTNFEVTTINKVGYKSKQNLGKLILLDGNLEFCKDNGESETLCLFPLNNEDEYYYIDSYHEYHSGYISEEIPVIKIILSRGIFNEDIVKLYIVEEDQRKIVEFLNDFNTKCKEENDKGKEKLRIQEERLCEDFANEVETLVSHLVSDKHIFQMTNNFFVNYNFEIIFGQIDNIFEFEKLIVKHYGDIGKNTLIWSLCREADAYSEEESFDLSLFLGQLMYFEKFGKVLAKRASIEDEITSAFVAWKLINLTAIDYYHNSFQQEYGQFFEINTNLSLENYIEIYSSIDVIDLSSHEQAMKFMYFLLKNEIRIADTNQNLSKCFSIIKENLDEIKQTKDLDQFEALLLKKPSSKSISINDVDLMTGREFEEFVCELFKRMGYKTIITKASGDQGVDVIAEKNGIKIGVQAKCYSNAVPNKAIQEVSAGLKHYNLTKGLVITNNYYTTSASELAYSNNIILWDRNVLIQKITELF